MSRNKLKEFKNKPMSLAIVMWTTDKSAEALFEFLDTLPKTFVVFFNPSRGKQYVYDPSNPDKTSRWMGADMVDGPPSQLSDNLDDAVKEVMRDGK